MYSRYQNRPEGRVQIPKDYGGSAFSAEKPTAPTDPVGRIEIARPTVSEGPTLPTQETAESLPPPEPSDAPELPMALPTGILSKGVGFPLAHGIGFEELLILGLILLVSQSDAGSETVLWLCLLLFCG